MNWSHWTLLLTTLTPLSTPGRTELKVSWSPLSLHCQVRESFWSYFWVGIHSCTIFSLFDCSDWLCCCWCDTSNSLLEFLCYRCCLHCLLWLAEVGKNNRVLYYGHPCKNQWGILILDLESGVDFYYKAYSRIVLNTMVSAFQGAGLKG